MKGILVVDQEQAKQEAFFVAQSLVASKGWKFDPDTDDEYDAIRDEMADWQYDDEDW